MRLIAANGPHKGQSYTLATDAPTLLGRHSRSIRLDDPRISRKHAAIALRDGKWVLKDLDSSNGTYLNNHKITSATLKEGDRIRVGRTVLVFSAKPAEDARHDKTLPSKSRSTTPAAPAAAAPAPTIDEDDLPVDLEPLPAEAASSRDAEDEALDVLLSSSDHADDDDDGEQPPPPLNAVQEQVEAVEVEADADSEGQSAGEDVSVQPDEDVQVRADDDEREQEAASEPMPIDLDHAKSLEPPNARTASPGQDSDASSVLEPESSADAKGSDDLSAPESEPVLLANDQDNEDVDENPLDDKEADDVPLAAVEDDESQESEIDADVDLDEAVNIDADDGDLDDGEDEPGPSAAEDELDPIDRLIAMTRALEAEAEARERSRPGPDNVLKDDDTAQTPDDDSPGAMRNAAQTPLPEPLDESQSSDALSSPLLTISEPAPSAPQLEIEDQGQSQPPQVALAQDELPADPQSDALEQIATLFAGEAASDADVSAQNNAADQEGASAAWQQAFAEEVARQTPAGAETADPQWRAELDATPASSPQELLEQASQPAESEPTTSSSPQAQADSHLTHWAIGITLLLLVALGSWYVAQQFWHGDQSPTAAPVLVQQEPTPQASPSSSQPPSELAQSPASGSDEAAALQDAEAPVQVHASPRQQSVLVESVEGKPAQ